MSRTRKNAAAAAQKAVILRPLPDDFHWEPALASAAIQETVRRAADLLPLAEQRLLPNELTRFRRLITDELYRVDNEILIGLDVLERSVDRRVVILHVVDGQVVEDDGRRGGHDYYEEIWGPPPSDEEIDHYSAPATMRALYARLNAAKEELKTLCERAMATRRQPPRGATTTGGPIYAL
jgi:hypothetical protein